MNKNLNKSKLSKKLKFISVASAITICVASSTGGTTASAGIFGNLWSGVRKFFSPSSSTSLTTNSSKLNKPSISAKLSGNKTSNSKGFLDKIKGAFGSSSSTTKQNGLETTDLDSESTSSSKGFFNRFKSLFNNNTSSSNNKSGVVDNGESNTFNTQIDDQNLKNLSYLIKASNGG